MAWKQLLKSSDVQHLFQGWIMKYLSISIRKRFPLVVSNLVIIILPKRFTSSNCYVTSTLHPQGVTGQINKWKKHSFSYYNKKIVSSITYQVVQVKLFSNPVNEKYLKSFYKMCPKHQKNTRNLRQKHLQKIYNIHRNVYLFLHF